MKRSMIAVAFAVLGLSGTVAIAEPSLEMSADTIRFAVPETTSYQAATNVQSSQDEVFTWNP
jgi:hypothetical protein